MSYFASSLLTLPSFLVPATYLGSPYCALRGTLHASQCICLLPFDTRHHVFRNEDGIVCVCVCAGVQCVSICDFPGLVWYLRRSLGFQVAKSDFKWLR